MFGDTSKLADIKPAPFYMEKILNNIISRFRFSNIINLCKQYGYRFSWEDCVSNGFIYKKKIGNDTFNDLLIHYNLHPIYLKDLDYEISDYIAIASFPERKSNFSYNNTNFIEYNGGLRFYHFYSIKIKQGDNNLQKSIYTYLLPSMGTHLGEYDLQNPKKISYILSGLENKISLGKFINNEIQFWKENKIDFIEIPNYKTHL